MKEPSPLNASGLAEGAVGANAVQSWLDSQRASLLDFCYRLIETPSPNPPGDERAVIAVICEELSRLKLTDHEIIASDPRRPNLLLWLRGKQAGPLLLYNAHVDTKPVGDQRDRWETDPLKATLKEGRIYGLGAADMKAAVAAFVYALAALKENTALQGTLCLALTADEEAGSRFGAGYLVREAKIKADMALIGEPSGIKREWEFLHLGHRGSSCFKIKLHGTQGHSSISNLIPTVNASLKMAQVMLAMRDDFHLHVTPHPFCQAGITLNIGVHARGGVFYGVTPGYAEFGCDIRVLPGVTRQGLESDLQAFLEQLRQHDPSLDVKLEFEEGPLGWTEPTEVNPDLPIVRALQSASQVVLGHVPPFSLYPATTDSAHFQTKAGIPTVPSFGPGMISLAHGPNEWVGIESTVQAAKIYALAAYDVLK